MFSLFFYSYTILSDSLSLSLSLRLQRVKAYASDRVATGSDPRYALVPVYLMQACVVCQQKKALSVEGLNATKPTLL
jgi:hypothetical protein